MEPASVRAAFFVHKPALPAANARVRDIAGGRRRIGKSLVAVFQLQQALFAPQPCGISGEAAVAACHAVTGDEDADGVVPYRTSHGLCRHARQAQPRGYPAGHLAVGHGRAVGNGAQDAPHAHAEGGAPQVQVGHEARVGAVEVGVEPPHRIAEHRQQGMPVPALREDGGMALPLEPQARKPCAGGREDEVAQGRGIDVEG